MLTKLTRHGQITLPKAVRERLRLVEGDYIDVEVSEDDRGIVLRPRKMVAIDPDLEWFWTPEWQQAERVAEDDLSAGHVVRSRPGERASETLRRAVKTDAGQRPRSKGPSLQVSAQDQTPRTAD